MTPTLPAPRRGIRSLPGRAIAKLRRSARARLLRRRLAAAGASILVEPGAAVTGGHRVELADGVRLMANCHLWATDAGQISIGARTYVGSNSWVVANASVRIGANVLIAPFCYIQDTDHGFEDVSVPIQDQPSKSTPIVIEDDVWLGAHVVVTRGVTIGRGSVVGAGSIVTRDIAPYSIAVGSPARVVRTRGTGS